MYRLLAVSLMLGLALAVAPAAARKTPAGSSAPALVVRGTPGRSQSGVDAPAAARRRASTQGDAPSRQATATLERARTALGGTDRLATVRSLTAESKLSWASNPERAQPFGFAMLLPDRFRRRSVDIVHTIDGTTFWQSHDNPPEILKQAEGNIRVAFVKTALVFLLRPLPWFPLISRRVADARLGTIRAEVVEFTGRDHFLLRLLFDPTTFQPLGYSVPWDVNGASLERLVRLEDYRQVSGIRLPFRLVDTLGGQPNNIEVFTGIQVNPPLTPADFKKK